VQQAAGASNPVQAMQSHGVQPVLGWSPREGKEGISKGVQNLLALHQQAKVTTAYIPSTHISKAFIA
jgi:hypothetical protein